MNPFNSYELRVNIAFPKKTLSANYEKFLPPNTLSFMEDGYPITVTIDTLSIPHVLSESEVVYKEIMRLVGSPIIDEVKSDVNSAKDLLRELDERFVKKGKHHKGLFYEKKVDGDNAIVKVYDYHKLSPTPEEEYPYLFQKLMNLRKFNDGLLNPKYGELHKLANSLSLGCEEGKVPFIQGPTLRQAVEDALTVYRLDDEINTVPITNIDIKLV